MKQSIFFAAVLWLLSLPVAAQSSLEQVLQQVESHNPELQAGGQRALSEKLQARAANNLYDPTATYSHLYGNQEGMGFTGEFILSQSFDFPTAYRQRARWAKARAASLDQGQAALRQQILLQAEELCLDLVWLNQQRQLLEMRRTQAEALAALYEKRLAEGDANFLETNKIQLELLNVKTEVRLNEAARVEKLGQLTSLNGGEPIAFADTLYPERALPASFDQYRAEALAAHAGLRTLREEQQVAQQLVRVNKAQGLPGLELGYRMNPSSGGMRYNGFLVGLSIPLFSNRHQVKQAQAQSRCADLLLSSATSSVEQELSALYQRAQTVESSMEEYRELLDRQNNLQLLNKAVTAGQISLIAYFVDVQSYYQSLQNYLQLQNEYQKALAKLYQYKR